VTDRSSRAALRAGQPSVLPPDDRELLDRAAAGDEAAVRVLFRTHAPRMHRQAARVLGSDDPDIEDVVQQAFLAALEGANRFDGRSSLSTWLFGITTRRALDSARARWRRRRWSRLAESVGLGTQSLSPDRRQEMSSDADALLAKLSPELRLVFVLHDVEGYTFAEISGITKLSISSLHGRLVSARAKLDLALRAESEVRDA
jgi:RNA polymerase sigma-70 factor (ECF subfamily)